MAHLGQQRGSVWSAGAGAWRPHLPRSDLPKPQDPATSVRNRPAQHGSVAACAPYDPISGSGKVDRSVGCLQEDVFSDVATSQDRHIVRHSHGRSRGCVLVSPPERKQRPDRPWRRHACQWRRRVCSNPCRSPVFRRNQRSARSLGTRFVLAGVWIGLRRIVFFAFGCANGRAFGRPTLAVATPRSLGRRALGRFSLQLGSTSVRQPRRDDCGNHRCCGQFARHGSQQSHACEFRENIRRCNVSHAASRAHACHSRRRHAFVPGRKIPGPRRPVPRNLRVQSRCAQRSRYSANRGAPQNSAAFGQRSRAVPVARTCRRRWAGPHSSRFAPAAAIASSPAQRRPYEATRNRPLWC